MSEAIVITADDVGYLFEALFRQGTTRPTPEQLQALEEGLRLRPASDGCGCGFHWVLQGLNGPDQEFGCFCKTDVQELLKTVRAANQVICTAYFASHASGIRCSLT